MKKGLFLAFLILLIILPAVFGFSISVDGPASNAVLSGINRIEITLSYSTDINGNTGSVYFYYKNMSEENYLLYANISTNFTKYSYDFNTANFEDTLAGYMNITASNNSAIYENVSVIIPIKINNNAPVYSIIPNLTWPEDTINDTLNLSMYFSDTEKRNTFTYSASSADDIEVSINSNTGIATIKPAKNFSGVRELRFTASDGTLSNTSNYVMLNVTSANDPPTMTRKIENRTWVKNTQMTVKVNEYFEDVDKDKLTYTSVVAGRHVTVTMDPDGIATLAPEKDFLGTDSVVFTVTDPAGLAASSNTVYLELIGDVDNKLPTINSIDPAEKSISLNQGDAKTFTITKSDLENDNLNVKWYLNDALVAENADSYAFIGGSTGAYTIKVDVSDGLGMVSTSWQVNVAGAEVIQEIPKCGNGIVDAGEDCESCYLDVACLEGEQCINKLCTRTEKESNTAWIIGIIGIVVAISVVAAFWYMKKKKEELFGTAKSITIEPNKKTNVKGLGGESPAADIGDFYYAKKEARSKINSIANKQAGTSRMDLEYLNKKEKGNTRTENVLLRNYVKMAMEKGKRADKIRNALISKGWNADQVDKAIKEFL